MPTLATRAGTELFYKDWGSGPAVVFSHGWPLCADAWDGQMLFLGQQGYRVIAHDRRSHGRSSQHWEGNDMDTYADDLGDLFDHLGLKDAVLIGHSTGGGEVARYIGRHGVGRLSKAVLVDAVTPHMAASVPLEVFDGIRKGVADNRAEFFRDFTPAFYGFNREGAKVSQGILDSFWMQGMTAGIAGLYDCVKAFSETDLTEDVRAMALPTLVIHGEDDQIVPFEVSAAKVMELAPQATLKTYPGAPHGLASTHQEQLNQDLLAFIRS